ncbi:MAG TPA: hypothetical protein VGF30_11130, partial [Bacteroidia bacterium]
LPIWGKFFQKVYADKTLKVSKGDFYRPARMTEVELDCEKFDQDAGDIFDTEDINNDPFDL